jgi:hypothetical protein
MVTRLCRATQLCAAGGIAALVLFGCATTGGSVPPKSAAANPPSTCLNDTATRLPSAGCPGPGNSHSANDLRQTGKVDVGDALQMVDPTVTAVH